MCVLEITNYDYVRLHLCTNTRLHTYICTQKTYIQYSVNRKLQTLNEISDTL